MPDEETTNQPSSDQAPPSEAEQQEATDQEESEQEETEQDKLKQAIQVETEPIGLLRTKLTVTVPKDTIHERIESQYDELRREATVPGFRRGRAPRTLIEKRFGGDVRDELKDKLVAEAYLAAVEKEDIKVLGEPDLELAKIELPDQGDLSFTCEVELKPEFDLPELEGIELSRPKIGVADKDIDAQIERMRAMRGNLQPVEDGKAEQDDLVVADVTIAIGSDTIHQEENAQVPARPSVIDGIPVESLGEQLTGSASGEVRKIEVTLPDGYRLEEHRGKKATIELKVQEIKRLVLPELDENLLKAFGADTLDELRDWVRANLEARLDQDVRRAMREQLSGYLLDHTELDVPPQLSQRQTERMVNRRRLDMLSQGVPEAEVEKNLDALRTTATEQVARDLKLYFVMEKIAEQLEIDVSEEEVNARIAQIAQAYGQRFDRVRDDLARRGGLTELYLELREQKCVDRLLEQAKITDTEAQPSEQADQQAKPAKAKKKAAKRRKPAAKDKDKGKTDADLADET